MGLMPGPEAVRHVLLLLVTTTSTPLRRPAYQGADLRHNNNAAIINVNKHRRRYLQMIASA